MYNELKLDLILTTLDTLQNRIAERFPGSGLSRVAEELQRVGKDIGPVLDRLRRPNRLLRAAIMVAVILIVLLVGALFVILPKFSVNTGEFGSWSSFLQAVESAAQDLIFLSV